jgi:hypothetical protein
LAGSSWISVGFKTLLHIFVGPFHSDVDLILTRLDGSQVQPGDAGVTFDKTSTFVEVFIEDAEAGEWLYEIVANELDPGGENIRIRVDEEAFVVPGGPPSLMVPGDQSVQYSDSLSLDLSAADPDDAADSLTFSATGLPSALTLTDHGDGTATVDGPVGVAPGTYMVEITVTDPDGVTDSKTVSIVVSPEDAAAAFDGDNPVAVQVADPGGDSGPFSLTVLVREAQPDGPTGSGAAGDIGLAVVSMSLVPVGPGSPAVGACAPGTLSGAGYDAVLPVTCDFDGIAVNAYTVQVDIGGGYYAGSAEDVLTVFDPSLGFATGGGWFYWPGTGERTNFGFTMKYNKKGGNVKGNLLLIRHMPDGSIYRVKSNALYGLALGDQGDFGWASFSGKSTYLEPGWPEPEGNYEFLVYVEDHDEPGTGVDRFWIEVKDKAREIVPAMSMDREATDNTVALAGGNIAVPYGVKK